MNNNTEEIEIRPYHHYEQLVTRRIQHFYISNPIDEPFHYVDMVHRIMTATPDDTIYIHLNTPGGQIDTGVQIINAMLSSPAHIIASVESEVHSLGTLIFLAADEFIVHDNCLMMFHNFSGGTFGKGNEQRAQINATFEWYSSITRKLYIPFLSEEEFELLHKDQDLYLQSDVVRERLVEMVRVKEEQLEQEAIEEQSKPKKKKKKKKKSKD